MNGNWPETMEELLEECKRLSSKYDLFQIGELNKYPDWPDGTENLSGEWQYGVAMIPAAWVLHVAATLGTDDSRWFELFGTPERAAETMLNMCKCAEVCEFCPLYEQGVAHCEYPNAESSVLEWLRGKAVS